MRRYRLLDPRGPWRPLVRMPLYFWAERPAWYRSTREAVPVRCFALRLGPRQDAPVVPLPHEIEPWSAEYLAMRSAKAARAKCR